MSNQFYNHVSILEIGRPLIVVFNNFPHDFWKNQTLALKLYIYTPIN